MKPRIAALVVLLTLASVGSLAQSASTVDPSHTVEPVDAVKLLSQKPLILNVGPRVLYAQAHIPGAEYVGMTYEPAGIAALRDHVQKVPKTRQIILYCGCCPWDRCPNIAPAFNELRSLGFKNVKVIHFAQNFGADWVNKGYPVEK